MKTRELINKTLNRKDLEQMKRLTTTNIALRILYIMKNCIGAENAISRSKLFYKIFGRAEEITLADDLRWEYVKRAMHFCRVRTKCFIGSMCESSTYKYFVLETLDDAKYYVDTLDRNIKRMRIMQQKAIDSVKNGWHRVDWISDSQSQLGWKLEEKL